jgi:hypothetical protein
MKINQLNPIGAFEFVFLCFFSLNPDVPGRQFNQLPLRGSLRFYALLGILTSSCFLP